MTRTELASKPGIHQSRRASSSRGGDVLLFVLQLPVSVVLGFPYRLASGGDIILSICGAGVQRRAGRPGRLRPPPRVARPVCAAWLTALPAPGRSWHERAGRGEMEAVRILRGPDRRRARQLFVQHERRSGFDRRQRARTRFGAWFDAALVHLRDNPASLCGLLLLGNLLSFADLLLTQMSLSLGAAEINPLMRHLLALEPASAGAAKLALIAAATLAIWAFRRFRLVLAIGVYLVAFYCCIVLYQIVGIARLL